MDSVTYSILCNEFSRLSIELQYQEIGNLFNLVGGIRISQNRNETDQEFRIRLFGTGLMNLSHVSEYEREFFVNRIYPSLMEDFIHSSIDKQERLIDKLSELTYGVSMKRKSGESDHVSRVQLYSQLMQNIPPGYVLKMVEFLRQIGESNEDEYNAYFHNSTSNHSQQSYYGNMGPTNYSGSRSRSVSPDGHGGDTEPVEEGSWNNGSKKAGFNPKLKLKAKSKPSSSHTSNSKYKPHPGRRY